jgi:hypothetical protein
MFNDKLDDGNYRVEGRAELMGNRGEELRTNYLCLFLNDLDLSDVSAYGDDLSVIIYQRDLNLNKALKVAMLKHSKRLGLFPQHIEFVHVH